MGYRVLVTGGGGFIGSHLVRALAQRGDQVRVLDNGSSGSPERIADVREEVEWVDGDVRDQESVRRASAGAEVIFHQAALASVPQSIADPLAAQAVNVLGTLHILQAAREQGVRRVIFASSCALYGDDPMLPKVETMCPMPLSPYAVQKLAAESYCRIWPTLFGLETVTLRYFNVFGPAQDPHSQYAAVIPRFITAALDHRAPTIYGDGEQSRDFIYVEDVVRANLLAADATGAVGGVFNIGGGRSTTLNELIAWLRQITGREITPQHMSSQPGDVRASLADCSNARARLGFMPQIELAEGLAHTVAWFDAIRLRGA